MSNQKIEQLLQEEKESKAKLEAEAAEISDFLAKESGHLSSLKMKQDFDRHNLQSEDEEIDRIFAQENEHVKKLHKIVKETIRKEKLIINNLLHPQEDLLTKGQQLSDKVATFGGSWKFIIIFGIILAVWMLFNILAPQKIQFDSFPFIFLNLILSCLAAIQAPIIMMSQNRQEEKDRKRGENDYLVNLKAEMQIRSLHKKMNLLLEKQIKTLYENQAKQILMLKEINHKLTEKTST